MREIRMIQIKIQIIVTEFMKCQLHNTAYQFQTESRSKLVRLRIKTSDERVKECAKL